MNEILGAALRYAKMGIPVLPLWHLRPDNSCGCGRDCGKQAGKHPLTNHGVKDASTDPAIIRQWFDCPPGAPIPNIGGAMGRGLVAIDEDTPGSLLATGITFPNAPCSTTGRGQHLFFKENGVVIPNRAHFAPGLDTRSDNGYVVLPPSRHYLGTEYRWVAGHSLWEIDPPYLPAAAAELMVRASKANGAAHDDTPHDLFGRLDLEETIATIQALPRSEGGRWRELMLPLIAAMVGRRWPDEAVLTACRRTTWTGCYSQADTDKWVADEIRRARAKFNVPDPDEDGDTFTPDEPAPDLDAALRSRTLDFHALSSRTPEPRQFAWASWVPASVVTLLHSVGGVGKSLLGQQLASAYALGIDLFGGATEGRPAFMLAGEDDHNELWRRQIAICQRLGVSLGGLAGKFDPVAAADLDVTMAVGSEAGTITATPLLAALRRRIEAERFGLIVLDNSAKLFAVREGDRIGVTRCVGLLNSICHDFGTTIVLIAHDNKNGDFSGSTAWENSCRSRLHLTRNDEGGVTMAMPKANYASTGSVKLVWDNWSFRVDDPAFMTGGERLQAKMDARAHGEVFLRALDALIAQGCNVSANKRAANYAPRAIVERGVNEGLAKRQLELAMLRLLKEGRVKENQPVVRGSDRHWKHGLARSTHTPGGPS